MNDIIPPLNNARDVKKLFSSSLNSLFSPAMAANSLYNAGDLVNAIRNSITRKLYIETYVRNNPSKHTPSADTVFRWLRYVASEQESYNGDIYDGSSKENNSGIDAISGLIDLTVRIAVNSGAFKQPVNVAIDEHDEPYYGMDNRYLINAPFHKFRGTDKAYRFATLDTVKKGERFTLAVMKKNQLDGIDNAMEVGELIKHAISLGIKIDKVLIDRGYLDVGVIKTIEGHKLEYIVPAKDNTKVKKFKKMEMEYHNSFSFLVIRDTISSGKESVNSSFVHVVYYPDGKKHDFSFYTNMDVNEYNVIAIAELYRERWCIENGYLEKKETKEKTHSTAIAVRYFLYFLAVLLYNLWILINLVRIKSGYSWLILMDFLIAMGRGKWVMIMNDNG